jgi:hypothetical protein
VIRAAATAFAATTLALTACQTGGGPREPRVVEETRFLDALSGAIDGVNATRARLAADANAISAAAAALDDVDDVAVDGNREAVRARRPKADRAMAKASPAARRLNKDVRAYRDAVTALDGAATEGLDAAQQAAIDGVVAAARAELGRLRSYATVVASVWPRFEQLNETQKLWLARYSNGWYRDQREAAGAYVTMIDRTALARDRSSLARADARRLAAAKRASDAIAEARGALASLTG